MGQVNENFRFSIIFLLGLKNEVKGSQVTKPEEVASLGEYLPIDGEFVAVDGQRQVGIGEKVDDAINLSVDLKNAQQLHQQQHSRSSYHYDHKNTN